MVKTLKQKILPEQKREEITTTTWQKFVPKLTSMQVKMVIPRQSNTSRQNPQFEREHSLELQAGLPEETKRKMIHFQSLHNIFIFDALLSLIFFLEGSMKSCGVGFNAWNCNNISESSFRMLPISYEK